RKGQPEQSSWPIPAGSLHRQSGFHLCRRESQPGGWFDLEWAPPNDLASANRPHSLFLRRGLGGTSLLPRERIVHSVPQERIRILRKRLQSHTNTTPHRQPICRLTRPRTQRCPSSPIFQGGERVVETTSHR